VFDLGQVCFEKHKNSARARNPWGKLALRNWHDRLDIAETVQDLCLIH